MKKLLALILCVMMFVSVIPMAAFAEEAEETDYSVYPYIDNPLMTAAQYKTEINNMIANTKQSIADAYGVLVGNKVVYTTAKGMDSTIVSLVDALAKKLIDNHTTIVYANGDVYEINKELVDGVKDQIRLLMDGLVYEKMVANEYKFVTKYNDDGTIAEYDPIKKAQVFADAVNAALTNKNFQKGYQAVATFFAMADISASVNKELADQYAAFIESVDGKFDASFNEKYPELWENYIDTLEDIGTYKIDDAWALIQLSGIGNPFVRPEAEESTEEPTEPTDKGGATGGDTDVQ